jgi:hypothetical protein
MAQNRCSQAEALKTLIDAARNRKQKVLLIATEFLHSLVIGTEQTTLGPSPDGATTRDAFWADTCPWAVASAHRPSESRRIFHNYFPNGK